jgi:hypothetical protein
MGAGVLQQGPHLRRSVGSATWASKDNSLLHIRHYDRAFLGLGLRL